MPKLIPKISPADIKKLLPDSVDKSEIKEDLIELDANASLPHARKRFFRLCLDGSPDLHLSYGEELKETFERSKAFNAALPQYTCKPVFLVEDGERHLFGQEFFDGTPIDESFESGRQTAEEVTSILKTISSTFASIERPSSNEAMVNEFEQFKDSVLSNENFLELDRRLLTLYLFPRLKKALYSGNPKIRWSSGDLAARNILADGDQIFRIIDCEFAQETHFYEEDWLRLAKFSLQSFKELDFVQDLVQSVSPGIDAFSHIRQVNLNKIVHSAETYQQHARRDLAECLWSLENNKAGNDPRARSLAIEGIAIIKNEWMSKLFEESKIRANKEEELAKEKEIRTAKEEQLRAEKEIRTAKEEELTAEKEIRTAKEEELTAEKEIRTAKEGELVKEKEMRLAKEAELTAEKEIRDIKEEELTAEKEVRAEKEEELVKEKEIRAAKEEELAVLEQARAIAASESRKHEDKVRRMQDSFSWKTTAPLRFLRRYLLDPWRTSSTPDQQDSNDKSSATKKPTYAEWIRLYDTITAEKIGELKKNADKLKEQPLLSVLMPTFNTSEKFLRKAIESVINQIYEHWELCIADDASTKAHVRKVLKEYADRDSRIKIVHRKNNGHISEASNSAAEIAKGDFLVLLDHDDELRPHSLYWVAKTIINNSDVILIYSDEDKIDEHNQRFSPFFKPDWNPDLLRSQNYICHLVALKRQTFTDIGGFRKGFEGSQDWDLLLRITENLPSEKIVHIPRILYHWRTTSTSTAASSDNKDYAHSAAQKALQEHYERKGVNAEPVPLPNGYFHSKRIAQTPSVTIIIPTCNGGQVLERCIDSIQRRTRYDREFNLLVVDNDSDDPNTLKLLPKLQSKNENLNVLPDPAPFNFSAINNRAAKSIASRVLVFLNDDTEVDSEDWLSELSRNAIRPEIGAVGGKLLYPNGKIQHAGVILGIGGVAGHAFRALPSDFSGQMNRANITHNVSAVTGACLAIEREKFFAVEGFNEKQLSIAFNDVDLCLKLLEKGYRNLYLPQVRLKHYESYSRGLEDTPEKQARFKREINFMQDRWGSLLQNDPCYNPNFSLQFEQFELGEPERNYL